MKRVAVVILNYNGKKWLAQFLPSVIQHTTYANAEIIVADNASTDDSILFLEQKFPNITIIENTSNSGYAGGYNQALANINADIFCLLNSDIETTPNWIEQLLSVFDDPLVAAAQPKILAYHNKQYFEYAGAAGGFIDKYGYPFCRGRLFDTTEKDIGQYNDTTEVFWATGACLFVRAELFKHIGGFDEDFFAHMEEIDLCWRLKNLGYKIMYVGNSTVYHVGGGTLQKSNPRKTYLNFRNNRYLLHKNLSEQEHKKITFRRNCLDIIACIVAVLKGNLQEAKSILQALSHYQRDWDILHQKHIKTRQQMDVHAVEQPNPFGKYQQSIIMDYFIYNKTTYTKLPNNKFKE